MNEMDDNTKEILSPRVSATMAYRTLSLICHQAVQTVESLLGTGCLISSGNVLYFYWSKDTSNHSTIHIVTNHSTIHIATFYFFALQWEKLEVFFIPPWGLAPLEDFSFLFVVVVLF